MNGLVVAVTGARRGGELVEAFQRRGASVVHAPMLGGDDPAPDADIAADTEVVLNLRPQWIVATTGVGMRLWLEAADRTGLGGQLRELMAGTRCIARSAKAVGGLALAGIKPIWTAPRETDATVAAWLAGRALPGDGVAVQMHGGRAHAYDTLRPLGIDMVSVMPYRTQPPLDLHVAVALVHDLLAGRIGVLTFTSPGAVRNLVDVAATLGEGAVERLQEVLRTRTAVAAVGPVTAGTCEDVGIVVRITPSRHRSMDLVREVEAWFERRAFEAPLPLRLDPATSSAVVEDRPIALGQREYLVLAMLARRSGTVCRTEELLVQGWGHEASEDPTAVKHQVSRLRRKLDGTPLRIQTVRGVGYRLVAA